MGLAFVVQPSPAVRVLLSWRDLAEATISVMEFSELLWSPPGTEIMTLASLSARFSCAVLEWCYTGAHSKDFDAGTALQPTALL